MSRSLEQQKHEEPSSVSRSLRLVGLFQVNLSRSVASFLSSPCLEWAAGLGRTDVWVVTIRTLKEAVVGPQAEPTIPHIEGIHYDGQ